MSDSGFNLPKYTAAKMVNDSMMGDTLNKETVFDTHFKNSKSMKQKSVDKLQDFTNSISQALKKMKLAYYEQVN